MKRSCFVRFALIAMGTVLLLNAVILVATFRSNFGVVPLSVYSSVLILYGAFFNRLRRFKWLRGVMICGSAALVVFSASLFAYGSRDTASYDEDYIIVLGSGVRGEQVTPNLAKRLDRAAEYYGKNPDCTVIVSGGQGPGESISEALAMERYLAARGVPVQKILKEDASTSTYENFEHSKQLMEQQDGRVVFVTSRFHVYRAQLLAKRLGIDASHIGSGIVWYSVSMNYMREMLAVAKTWVFG